jgi:hypothetical protein
MGPSVVQVSPVMVNWSGFVPTSVALVTCRPDVPVFVTTKVCEVELVFTIWFP